MGNFLMCCVVGGGERDLQLKWRQPLQPADLEGRRCASGGHECLSRAPRPWLSAEFFKAAQRRGEVVPRLTEAARIGQPGPVEQLGTRVLERSACPGVHLKGFSETRVELGIWGQEGAAASGEHER